MAADASCWRIIPESPALGAGASEASDLGAGCTDLSAVSDLCLAYIGDNRPLVGIIVGSKRAAHCTRRTDIVEAEIE